MSRVAHRLLSYVRPSLIRKASRVEDRSQVIGTLEDGPMSGEGGNGIATNSLWASARRSGGKTLHIRGCYMTFPPPNLRRYLRCLPRSVAQPDPATQEQGRSADRCPKGFAATGPLFLRASSGRDHCMQVSIKPREYNRADPRGVRSVPFCWVTGCQCSSSWGPLCHLNIAVYIRCPYFKLVALPRLETRPRLHWRYEDGFNSDRRPLKWSRHDGNKISHLAR